MNDHELLQDYVQNGSQGAFAQLVERHVNLVYSTAHRQVRDMHLAEDVTQQVFTLLARKAPRLGNDTILSAWLYRAARHLASETVRRESRRHRREQLAVETMSQSTSDDTWRQIEPLLDEAMAKLSAADHDAVVLRYFENLPLQEVGAALGSSEDAAQKRVTRALERLRVNLTRRGVKVSVATLAAAVTGGAVQSAPAGLAASAASVSLAAAVGTTFTSNFLQFIATTNVKLISTAAVLATLSVSLVLLYNQNSSLRRELADLRASALESVQPHVRNGGASEPGLSSDELQRLRREHLDLLSLRGRVTMLDNELQQRKVAGAQASGSPNPAQEADSILFAAALTNRVTSGNTLVAGGWTMAGMRGYILLTPVIGHGDTMPDGQQLTVQGKVVGAPESFWDEIGWGSFKSDTRRSMLASELTPEHVDLLLQALKEANGAMIISRPPTTGQDGKRMGFGYSRKEDDGTVGVLMGIDFIPKITPDGLSVDLELFPSPVSPNTPIHSSLK